MNVTAKLREHVREMRSRANFARLESENLHQKYVTLEREADKLDAVVDKMDVEGVS